MYKYPHIQRLRVDFGKIKSVSNPPPLLKIQKDSYDWFLQKDVAPENRRNQGFEAVFKSVFPISDFGGTCTLEYVSYRLGEPKYDETECKIRGVTFAAPIRVSLRLIIWEKDEKSTQRRIHDIKEQEIYLGEFPLMSETGSFIVNGTERVIVSQLHKSSGVFFNHDKGKTHASGKLLYSAGIIPQRGSWIDFEFDAKDLLFVRIDRRRKFLASALLKALTYSQKDEKEPVPYTDHDLLDRFYYTETVLLVDSFGKEENNWKFSKYFDPQSSQNQRAVDNIKNPKNKQIIVNKGKKISKSSIRKIQEAKITVIPTNMDDIIGRFSLHKIEDSKGEIIVETNGVITKEILTRLIENEVKEITLLFMGNKTIGPAFRNTLAADKVDTPEEAIIEIYKKMKPGDPPTLEVAKNMLQNMFFRPERYDLSNVGRMKINKKLDLDIDLNHTILTDEDIFAVVEYLLRLKDGAGGTIDDIDHLGNRRVRGVGELLENQVRIGLVRMERAIKERMSLQETETMMLHDIVNSKPVSAVINEFFGSSQLSQFMDQTNPLSEITHKRRLSALGPGGLTRERAGFEVRDVHTSHYGRICPVETPEGPNIGLISSIATYARLNEYGFIETPYRKIKDTLVTDDVTFLTAIDEGKFKIAQANALVGLDNKLVKDIVKARQEGEFKLIRKEEIDFMDVSPKQLVSVAASLIPFLEHDDANRALMGSNMQRQAVPVVKPEAPLVGTGIEYQVANDSGSCIVAKRSGKVDRVDAERIVVEAEVDLSSEESAIEANVDIYHLRKYHRSNQNTCINQRPIVSIGDKVVEGQIVADGGSCDNGELALGQNILVAFMPWHGYNYEDSILVSEKLLYEDRFTSVHIEELEVLARDTKLGKELITRDIPNVSEYALRNLDASGIIRIGSYVKSGDILCGKTTPKGEMQLNPEEKLLRAIFGEKAGDVRDTSLRVPQGIQGVVIDVKVFNRRGVEKDERTKEIEAATLQKIDNDYFDEVRIVKNNLIFKALPILKKQPLAHNIVSPTTHEIVIQSGEILTEETFKSVPTDAWKDITITDSDKNSKLQLMLRNASSQLDLLTNIHESKRIHEGRTDDLQPGVIRTIKVYVAMKRRLSVGDKMAGRHGNKGVISKLISPEEMPYMADGTPVDIVLNPLGVPSRMNVGQVLETHLGLAASYLGERIEEMMKEHLPIDEMKQYVKGLYSSDYITEYVDSLDDEGVLDMIRKLKKGVYFSTPVFDGATEEDIHDMLDKAGLDRSAQMTLYDGRTGDRFDQKITVGFLYILKLHHLVDDKLHARSIGPYSLVTQQPLGGKAQFGGQRFGEMEVWALEAYGAAYTLKELLTVKSDDTAGRNKIYESIVKGNHDNKTGIPEAFKVLINELKSLCLDFELIREESFFQEF